MNTKCKTILSFLIILALLLGCSTPINMDPSIIEIRKMGFLSVYINDRFHDRKGYKEDLGLEMLGFFDDESELGKKEVPEKLVKYFVEKFEDNIQSRFADKLEWVSPSAYIGSASFQKPLKQTEELDFFDFDDSSSRGEEYLTPYPGLKLLPLNKIVKRFNIEGEGTDLSYSTVSSSVSYEEIGGFSQSLGLDALIIVEIDGGYDKLDFLEGNKLKPSITLRLLMIDKKGRAVLSMGEVFKNERKVYTGDIVSANLADLYIDFTSNPQPLLASYQQAIDEALSDIFSQIQSAWP